MRRLPLWVYWTLAGLGVAAAGYFTLLIDPSTLQEGEALPLYFTIWGGPITLVLCAALITWIARRERR